MANNRHEDALRDIVAEINIILDDETIQQDNEFYRGYRSGMLVILKAIQDELSAFNLLETIELVDIDHWFANSSACGAKNRK